MYKSVYISVMCNSNNWKLFICLLEVKLLSNFGNLYNDLLQRIDNKFVSIIYYGV